MCMSAWAASSPPVFRKYRKLTPKLSRVRCEAESLQFGAIAFWQ